MPYASVAELPANVKRKLKTPKKRRQWMHVWNSAYDRHGDESRAFAEAWATVQKTAQLKITKADAGYVEPSAIDEKCRDCSMFRAPETCTLVVGVISPSGWCRHFDRKKSQKIGTVMTDFNFYLPISKVEKQKDGSVLISGYASTPALDLDGEVVSLDAVKKALPGYWAWRNIREMHTPSAVGVAKEANVDEKGLFLTSKIIDQAAVKKVLEGVYKGYSIGGRKLAKSGNTITEIELVEVSVVDRPANPECKFEVAKAAKADAAAYLVKTPAVRRDPREKALGQMAKAVKTLAKAPAPISPNDSRPEENATRKDHDPNGPDGMVCPRHGLAECSKCSMKKRQFISKREFSDKQRQQSASRGHALSTGGFPIENKKDLQNARRAFGRAKDKAKTRALIQTRARQLGVKLPDKWKKKQAQALIVKAAAQKVADLDLDVSVSGSASTPPFLTLDVGKRQRRARPADDVLGKVELGHGLELVYEKSGASLLGEGGTYDDFLDLNKGMSAAGSLSGCFDQIRSVQRTLMMEAKREGGDQKDKALAKELGGIAQRLAAVIGQKASHEGEEALDLSDADDQWLSSTLGEDMTMGAQIANADGLTKFLVENGIVKAGDVKKRGFPTRANRMANARQNLRKARKVRKEAADAVADAHKVLKAAYLAKQALVKAGKKPPVDDGDDDDMGKAMSSLQKAFGALNTMKTFMKAADGQIKKAASVAGRSGQRGQETSDGQGRFYQVPAGVHDLSPADLATASPGGEGSGSVPPMYPTDGGVYPGKVAKRMQKAGYVSAETAEALARAAAAEAKVEVLERTPVVAGNGRRPYAFNVNKAFNTGGDVNNGNADLTKTLFEGVDPGALMSGDEQAHTSATAKIIGNMVTNPGKFGKSVLFDANFRGGAGFKAANGS